VAPGNLAHVSPAELSSAVIAAVRDAVADGELAVPVPDRVPVAATAGGDYATPIALRLARAAGRPAHEVAALLAKRLAGRPGVASAEVTGPGFVTVAVEVPLTARIDESYGIEGGISARISAGTTATWPVYPMTFENPGFCVRFAYARACGVRRHARDLGIEAAGGTLDDPRERRLLALLTDLPVRAERAARCGDARPFSRHLERIADAYHDVHEQCPALPSGDEPVRGRHAARVSLAGAVRIAVGNGLRMLGETPADRL
jgi:arginyl-tRNA synthetase